MTQPPPPAPRIAGLRMQYHLRESPQGTLAWDVHRLIALAQAQALPVQQLPLAHMAELDENHWFAHGEPPTPRALLAHWQLVQAADLRFPITVSAQGRVMDGMHRILKALHLGHTHIAAQQFAVTPPPDFIGVHPDDLPYD